MFQSYDDLSSHPTAQVYKLRKDGEIEQAYELAHNLFLKSPDDYDAKNAYAWTLIDLCKHSLNEGDIQEAKNWMSSLSELDYTTPRDNFSATIAKQRHMLEQRLSPEHIQIQKAFELSKNGDSAQAYMIMAQLANDGLLPSSAHENYGWIIYKYLRDNISSLNSIQARSILRDYILLSNERPSILHSMILNFALNYSKKDPTFKFLSFFKLWDPTRFRDEDWEEETGKNGEKYRPLAIKALKKAADGLCSLSIEAAEDFTWLIDLYDIALEKFPDDDWTIRSKARLLIKGGKTAEAEQIYRKLSLTMGDKYYIWQEFANCVDDVNIKIGMLSKAICSEKNEDFIGKIRIDLAEQLINAGKKSNAAFEIRLYKEHYESRGWAVNSKAEELLACCGEISNLPQDNTAVYAAYIPLAEEYAYSEIPYTDLVLIDKWKSDDGKTFQKFINCKNRETVVNTRKFPLLKKAELGQIWEFKLYNESEASGIPLVARKSDMPDWSILQESYGYVSYVNEDKKTYHIYTRESNLVFEHYVQKKLSQGDFLHFRQYIKSVKNEERTCICCIHKCAETDAIPFFMNGIAAVDNVNEKKQLFHFILSQSHISGIMHYAQTTLRPAVGDCLRIFYILEKNNSWKSSKKNEIIVLKAEPTNESSSDIVRHISGILKLKHSRKGWLNDFDDDDSEQQSADYAFVEDCYVHKSILAKYNIAEDCHVSGRAVYTGNGRWSVFELDSIG